MVSGKSNHIYPHAPGAQQILWYAISSLTTKIDKNWPNWEDDRPNANMDIWKEEWVRHGYVSAFNEFDFFNEVLGLYVHLPVQKLNKLVDLVELHKQLQAQVQFTESSGADHDNFLCECCTCLNDLFMVFAKRTYWYVKRVVVQLTRLTGLSWDWGTSTRDPSTVESGSALCYSDDTAQAYARTMQPTPNLERASQHIVHTSTYRVKPDQCSTILMSPLGLQARATKLDVHFSNLEI
ncbi:hypothetical protein C5167_037016 [Papaver somniferum]|uniref:Uncharacterized protein n=1 Tax=Papaver somniferum TaxID=3469 RepID=A0A4Y7I991_PAPSO|nr:hypothetical protein C5167_037016 [Papaver somniferum]